MLVALHPLGMPVRRSLGDHDPFAHALRPPPNETTEAKLAREQREHDAKRVSDQIDSQLRTDRANLKKISQTTVKVLLLGQAESGKSTTLKNFRLAYAPELFAKERASWKAVIQLNLIRAVIRIMDEVKAALDRSRDQNENGSPHTSARSRSSSISVSAPRRPPVEHNETANTVPQTTASSRPTTSPVSSNRPTLSVTTLIPKSSDTSLSPPASSTACDIDVNGLTLLLLRLSPLRSIELELKKYLGGASQEVGPEDAQDLGVLGPDIDSLYFQKRKVTQEWAVRSAQWSSGTGRPRSRSGSVNVNRNAARLSSVSSLISSLSEDIHSFWSDPSVRRILSRRRILQEVEDSAGGYFLQSVHRIASPSYEPTNSDVMRARLRTLGVNETRLSFSSSVLPSNDFGKEWILYDLGGSRTQRHAWLPFFDSVNAIIFLAPISCFDERLVEDSRVNRLEDSFHLWISIVSSKLLSEKTTLILFLNKCDLLNKKLASGIQVKDYLPSFGDRENSTKVVTKYFRQKFKDIVVQQSHQSRVCYIYPTSVTDLHTTAKTLETVKDGIIREHLKFADLL